MMRVGFERNVRGGPAGPLACLLQRDRLGVFDVFKNVTTLTHDQAQVIGDNAADQRAGADAADSTRGQIERAPYQALVLIGVLDF